MTAREPQEGGTTGARYLSQPQDASDSSQHLADAAPDRLLAGRRWLTGAAAVAALVTGLLTVLGAASSPVFRVVSGLAAIVAFVLFLWDAAVADLRKASRRRRLVYVVGAAVIATVLVVAGLATRTAILLHRLPGTQDVAVAGFAARSNEQQGLFDDVAAALAERLAGVLGEGAAHDYTAAVERSFLQRLGGSETTQRDAWLSRFAGESNAEMVVGGTVADRASGQAVLSVWVYVSPSFVADAAELAGWYAFDEIILDRSLSSTHTRAALLDRITGGIGDITTFLDGVDAYQAGQPGEAIAAFDAMIGDGSATSGSADGVLARGSLVDMAVLFRGHALEAMAQLVTASERTALLDQAKADYELVAESPTVALRARLSLAGNEYLAIASAQCAPGSLGGDGLASVAATLRGLSENTALGELTRLKAKVNLAQVESCRLRSGVLTDDSVLDSLLKDLLVSDVSAAGAERVSRQRIVAFAHSIAATNAANAGRTQSAVAAIDRALALDGRVERQSLWQGLKSGWLLRLCRLDEAEAAQQESLLQLREAVARGIRPESDLGSYKAAFETDLAEARERCKEGVGG